MKPTTTRKSPRPPRDPNAWTREDWALLWKSIQAVSRKIAARHRGGRRT